MPRASRSRSAAARKASWKAATAPALRAGSAERAVVGDQPGGEDGGEGREAAARRHLPHGVVGGGRPAGQRGTDPGERGGLQGDEDEPEADAEGQHLEPDLPEVGRQAHPAQRQGGAGGERRARHHEAARADERVEPADEGRGEHDAERGREGRQPRGERVEAAHRLQELRQQEADPEEPAIDEEEDRAADREEAIAVEAHVDQRRGDPPLDQDEGDEQGDPEQAGQEDRRGGDAARPDLAEGIDGRGEAAGGQREAGQIEPRRPGDAILGQPARRQEEAGEGRSGR